MPPSVSERERLSALAAYDILDTPPEDAFTRIARLMGWAFDVPTALIAFVDAERVWVKATTGHEGAGSRECSFCIHVVTENEGIVVEDARRDPHFANTPLVTGASAVRFYAGAPVRTPNGIPIGTVGLYDSASRSLSDPEKKRLRDFAVLTTDELEYRRNALPEIAVPTRASGTTVQSSTAPVEDLPTSSAIASKLLRLTSDGLVRVGPERRIEWANERFVEMSGYSQDELRGRRLRRLLFGPATSDEALARVRRTFEQREPFAEELLHYRKSGAQYWVRVRGEPLFDDDGAFEGFLLVETDVTEARHQKDALVSLTSFYEQALTELPIEVAVMDPEGRYLFLNPAAVSDDEMREWLIGKTAADYARRRGLDPAPFEARTEWIRSVVEAREPDAFDDSVTTTAGETRHIMRVAHPVTDESGEVTRVFAYGVDVTDRKKREQKLREAKERAEEMSRLKTAFLANMSHEIRTPLTSIIGFAEVLADETAGRKGEMADLIHRSGIRLKQTLSSVLELARLEGGEMELRPQVHDLTARVRETVELLRPQGRANGLSLALRGPDAPVEVVVDGAAFDRVLTNLLTNAIKFTPDGGEITVTLQAENDRAELEVADTGIGIRESFQQRIFDAFEQEEADAATQDNGIGLGLTITKRLVDLMGGRIRIESAKEEGTTVTVVLPRDDDPWGEDAS